MFLEANNFNVLLPVRLDSKHYDRRGETRVGKGVKGGGVPFLKVKAFLPVSRIENKYNKTVDDIETDVIIIYKRKFGERRRRRRRSFNFI